MLLIRHTQNAPKLLEKALGLRMMFVYASRFMTQIRPCLSRKGLVTLLFHLKVYYFSLLLFCK